MPTRTKQHYLDMLNRNPNAGVGFTLAAAAVFAARHGACENEDKSTDECRDIARDLKQRYGENLTVNQVLTEMLGIDPLPQKLTCLRCNKQWTQRGDAPPKFCPKCNSPYWDKPRRG